MLSLALLTDNSVAAEAIPQLLAETGLFEIVFKGSPASGNVSSAIRGLRTYDPDLILLDLADWEAAKPFVAHIAEGKFRGVTIGFRANWETMDKLVFKEAGIAYLLRDPFSPAEIEMLAYEALHKERGIANPNIFAFLPAKAGGGCSTVALHAAAGLARTVAKNVLLIEADRRSGVYSILLNLDTRGGLDDALSLGSALTPVEWYQHVARVSGFHLLPANLRHRRRLPSWADYYQLLRYAEKQYDYLLVDLPEVINEATAEVVRSARLIFLVCTPEVASLKMANFRAGELEACEIPKDRIHILMNRWERNGTPPEEIEEVLERPVFSVLPNQYDELKQAILESRLAAPESPFAEACRLLARKFAGLPNEAPERSKFSLLRKLSRIAG